MTSTDRNCLSFWFPILQRVGAPVPETHILRLSDASQAALYFMAHDEKLPAYAPNPWPDIDQFLSDAACKLGLPFFLRTGHGSGKHDWRDTCCVRDIADARQHVLALVNWSQEVDMIGLPIAVWAARRMLDVVPFFVCAGYRDMPVVREWRFFIRDGVIECVHPYWPVGALRRGRPNIELWQERLPDLYAPTPDAARQIVEQAAPHFDGYWSMDVLEATDGYYVTDMAEGSRSWHWPDCEHERGDTEDTEITENST